MERCKNYSHSVGALILLYLISITYYLSIVFVQLMCNSPFTLHVLFTLVQLLQFNSLRNHLLHIVRRRTCLIHPRSSVLSVHLFFCVTRLPNCACFALPIAIFSFLVSKFTYCVKRQIGALNKLKIFEVQSLHNRSSFSREVWTIKFIKYQNRTLMKTRFNKL